MGCDGLMCGMSESIPAMAKRLEMWPLERLRPYANNARVHSERQVEKIARSIREFGFTAPILVDSEDGILAGHGRLQAAQLLGLAEAPVVVLDHLDAEQRRAYLLADNRLAEDASWDHELLAKELAAIDLDPRVLGFDEDDLARLHDGLELEALEVMATPRAGTERVEPEHGMPGAAAPEPEDDGTTAEAESGEVDERHVFSVNLRWDDREVVLAAVRMAKERWGLEGMPEALAALCREWMDEQGAGAD
ncbi:hypothetical protein LBMAG41_10720 [Cyanobium sp.]|nr:hypothetical protein LBMAG41_10720 [Cyanobium sp.]